MPGFVLGGDMMNSGGVVVLPHLSGCFYIYHLGLLYKPGCSFHLKNEESGLERGCDFPTITLWVWW